MADVIEEAAAAGSVIDEETDAWRR